MKAPLALALVILLACAAPFATLRAGSASPLAPHTELQGPFPLVRVIDGDTIAITVGGLEERVRLIGIDTPERDTPFGPRATAFMQAALGTGAVWLELDARERDRFGRLLAYVYVEDANGSWAWRGGRFTQANLAIAQAGLADLLTISPNVRYTELYVAAVREARAAGRGMWAGQQQQACVDINRAGIEELIRIVHIGTERAQQIVQLRPFRSVGSWKGCAGSARPGCGILKRRGWRACLNRLGGVQHGSHSTRKHPPVPTP